jgi:excisionase family DNA binding protein
VTVKNGRTPAAKSNPKPANEPETLLLTIPEVARHLRVHRSTVYGYIRDDRLKAIFLSDEGTLTRVPWDELVKFIAGRPRVHSP